MSAEKRRPRTKSRPSATDDQDQDETLAPTGMVPIKGPVSPEAPRRPARQPNANANVNAGANASVKQRAATGGEHMDSATLALLQTILDKVAEVSVTDEFSGQGARRLAEIFEELPDREDYPDYYEHIPEPVSLNEIQSTLANRLYRTPAAFHDDLRLVFLNAMHYNERGSMIWKDAKMLERLILDEWEKAVAKRQLPAVDEVRYIRSSDEDSKASESPAPDPAASAGAVAGAAPAAKKRRRARKASDVSMNDPDAAAQYEPFAQQPFGFELASVIQPAIYTGRKDPQALVQEIAKKHGFNGALADHLDLSIKSGKKSKVIDDPALVALHIMSLLQEYKDQRGHQTVGEIISYQPTVPDVASWAEIEDRLKGKQFGSFLHFSCTLVKLLITARDASPEGSPVYVSAITSHRLYNWITSPLTPLQLPDPVSSILASNAHGPGTTPLDLGKKDDDESRYKSEDGDADYTVDPAQTITPVDAVQIGRRLGTKDREVHDFVVYQGSLYKIGDYILLANPDDTATPIVAQIFRLWSVRLQNKTQTYINVCWYYRPEQTWHTPDTQFYVDELFKAGIAHDHTIEDVLGHCFVMFYTRYIRGRPKPPVWYPQWPLWICDSRYNEKEKSFNKIKSWNSCIPEELRGQEYDMDLYEKPILLDKVDSPLFSSSLKGPGRTITAQELLRKGLGGDIAKGHSKTSRPSIKAGKKTRRERSIGSAIRVVSPQGINQGTIEDETVHPTGDIGNGPQAAQEVELLYQDTVLHQPDQLTSPPSSPSHTLLASDIQLPLAGATDLARPTARDAPPLVQRVDITKLEPEASLPAQTARYFDRDEDGRVLWFSAPPLSQAKTVTAPYEAHSLNFLYLRATDGMHDSDGTYDLLGLDLGNDVEPSYSPSSASSSIIDTASTSSSMSGGKRARGSTIGEEARSYKFPKVAQDGEGDDEDVVVQNDLATHAGKNLELSLNAYETSESLAEALKELAEVYQSDALSVMPALAHDDLEDIATGRD